MKCKYHSKVELISLRKEDLKWLGSRTVKDKNPEHWRVCPKCNTMQLLPKYAPKKCVMFPTLNIECDIPSAFICSRSRKMEGNLDCKIVKLLRKK